MITIARLTGNGRGLIKEPETGRVLNVKEATDFLVSAEEDAMRVSPPGGSRGPRGAAKSTN